MPMYNYTCGACKKVSEILARFDEVVKECPECGKKRLKRNTFGEAPPEYHDTYSPMNPRRGRGKGGAGRIDPGHGMGDMGKHFN